MRMQVWSPALLSGLRIHCCHEQWGRLQVQIGSGMAVAVAKANSYSLDSTPSLGTSICQECGPKKEKKKRSRGQGRSYRKICQLQIPTETQESPVTGHNKKRCTHTAFYKKLAAPATSRWQSSITMNSSFSPWTLLNTTHPNSLFLQ